MSRRRIFDVVALLSLLACLGAATVWIASHTRVAHAAWSAPWLKGYFAATPPGWHIGWDGRSGGGWGVQSWTYRTIPDDSALDPTDRTLLGFRADARLFGAGGAPAQWTHGYVVVPYWSLVGLLAGVPALWVVRQERRRRRVLRRGLCPSCGYDLHAITERCPECGVEVPLVWPALAG